MENHEACSESDETPLEVVGWTAQRDQNRKGGSEFVFRFALLSF